MRNIEFEMSTEKRFPSDKHESTYLSGNINLEIGSLKTNANLVVDRFFGTDSILQENDRRNVKDAGRVIEILTQGKLQDYAFDSSYNRAFKLLDGKGPITGFSELFETEPLTLDQIAILEESLLSEKAFKKIYSFKERLIRFKGKRRKGDFPLDDIYVSKHPNESVVSIESCERDGSVMGVKGVLDTSINYARSTLASSRRWLTGAADGEDATAFINYWERKPAEERALDFLSEIEIFTKGKIKISE